MMYEMKDQFENMISDIQSHKLKSEAFQELGLEPDADHEQIRLAYKRLALKYHPDKHKNSQTAKEKFHKINESYICLVQSEGNSSIAEEMMCQFSTLFRYRVKSESGYIYFMSNPNADEPDPETRGSKSHRGNEIKKKLKKKQELNEFRGKDNLDMLESPNEIEIKEMKEKADKVAEELINEEDKAKKKAMKKREKRLRQREKKRQKETASIDSEIDFKKVEVHNGVKYEDQFSQSSEDEVKETVKLKPLQNGIESKNNKKGVEKHLNGEVSAKENKKNKQNLGKILNGFHEGKNKEKMNKKQGNENNQVQLNGKKKMKSENVIYNATKSSKSVTGKSNESSAKDKKATAGNLTAPDKMENNKQASKKDKNKIKNIRQKQVPKALAKNSSDSEEPAWDEHSAFFSKVASSSKIAKNKPNVISHITSQPQTDNEEKEPEDSVLRSKKLAMDGNELANKEQYGLAVEQFTRAILLYNKDFRYFGNRSFCFDRLKMYARALEDANTAISLNFGWPKGYFRRGRALTGLGRYIEAEDSFKKVLKLDKSCMDAAKELRGVQTKYLHDMGFSKSICDIALRKNERMSEALDFLLSGALSESNMQDVYVSDEEDNNLFENELRSEENIKNKEIVDKNNESSDDEEFKEIEYKSLWIGDLTPDVTERQLFDYFNQFGMVKSVNAMYARKCGFVNFYDTESTKNALLGGDNILIMNRNLIIRYPDRAFETNTSMSLNKPNTLVQNDQPTKGRRKECFYWRNRGCRFGDDCYNAHIPENNGIDIRPSVARGSLYD